MLEIHPKSATLCHFLDRPARLRGGKTRSARRCSIMSSDMTCARPSHTSTAWRGCTKNATSISADCSLSPIADHGNRLVPVGVMGDAPLRSRLGCGSLSTQSRRAGTLSTRKLTLPCGRGSDSAHHGTRPALSSVLPASPDSIASGRMSMRRSHGFPSTLLFEPCDADVRPRDETSGRQTEEDGIARQTTRRPGAALDSPLKFC
jgi:hypothetical protein